MVTTWNSYTDLLTVLDPVIQDQAQRLAKAMKRGKVTAAHDERLQVLLLLRAASAHFSPSGIKNVYTYLSLFPNTPII